MLADQICRIATLGGGDHRLIKTLPALVASPDRDAWRIEDKFRRSAGAAGQFRNPDEALRQRP
jgi:hypothetical protein